MVGRGGGGKKEGVRWIERLAGAIIVTITITIIIVIITTIVVVDGVGVHWRLDRRPTHTTPPPHNPILTHLQRDLEIGRVGGEGPRVDAVGVGKGDVGGRVHVGHRGEAQRRVGHVPLGQQALQGGRRVRGPQGPFPEAAAAAAAPV